MDPSIIAAGISAGGSLLGGLFGPKPLSARKQIHLQKDFLKWQWANQGTQLVNLREGAEAAGFNPLTVLGSGSAPYQTAHLPALADFGGISAGQAVSNAVQAGLAAYQAFSPAQEDMYQKTDQKVEHNASLIGKTHQIGDPNVTVGPAAGEAVQAPMLTFGKMGTGANGVDLYGYMVDGEPLEAEEQIFLRGLDEYQSAKGVDDVEFGLPQPGRRPGRKQKPKKGKPLEPYTYVPAHTFGGPGFDPQSGMWGRH